MFAAAFITHHGNVEEGNEYATHNSPGDVFAGPLYADNFQVGEQYNHSDTENGGKEENHAQKKQNTPGVNFHTR